jgi:hypothetical protein
LHQKGIDELRRLATFDNVCVNWAFLEFYLDGGNQRKKPRCRAISSVVVVSPDDHILLPCYHMHDERLKIEHKDGRSNLDEIWHSQHVQTRRKEEGSWSFCQGCTIWCYFETSFLWPPDKYFLLNAQSKGRWAKEKVKQFVELKTGINLTRKLPGSVEKELMGISTHPLRRDVSDPGAASSGGCGAVEVTLKLSAAAEQANSPTDSMPVTQPESAPSQTKL